MGSPVILPAKSHRATSTPPMVGMCALYGCCTPVIDIKMPFDRERILTDQRRLHRLDNGAGGLCGVTGFAIAAQARICFNPDKAAIAKIVQGQGFDGRDLDHLCIWSGKGFEIQQPRGGRQAQGHFEEITAGGFHWVSVYPELWNRYHNGAGGLAVLELRDERRLIELLTIQNGVARTREDTKQQRTITGAQESVISFLLRLHAFSSGKASKSFT